MPWTSRRCELEWTTIDREEGRTAGSGCDVTDGDACGAAEAVLWRLDESNTTPLLTFFLLILCTDEAMAVSGEKVLIYRSSPSHACSPCVIVTNKFKPRKNLILPPERTIPWRNRNTRRSRGFRTSWRLSQVIMRVVKLISGRWPSVAAGIWVFIIT